MQKKNNSSAAKYQEQESPPVARAILEKLGAKEELIKEVCDIISHHHHPGKNESLNYKCLYDADMIANMAECKKKNDLNKGEFETKLDRIFMTSSGKKLAKQVLIEGT